MKNTAVPGVPLRELAGHISETIGIITIEIAESYLQVCRMAARRLNCNWNVKT